VNRRRAFTRLNLTDNFRTRSDERLREDAEDSDERWREDAEDSDERWREEPKTVSPP
jgi:hypothetical protein